LALISTLSAFRRLISLFSFLSAFRLSHFNYSTKSLTFTLPSTDVLLSLAHSLAETAAVLTDKLYLFSRLSLIPPSLLSRRTARKFDKASDVLALFSSALSLLTVSRRRRQVYSEGRAARRRAVAAEERLAEVEFWTAGGGRSHRSKEEKEEAEGLREKERAERRTLRRLHEELGELWWERVRGVSEGVFARASLFLYFHRTRSRADLLSTLSLFSPYVLLPSLLHLPCSLRHP
jgi:hypothetical protein